LPTQTNAKIQTRNVTFENNKNKTQVEDIPKGKNNKIKIKQKSNKKKYK